MKLEELRNCTIAHTDSGDHLHVNGELRSEFVIPGKITKARAGLFFVEVEGEKFSAHKQKDFSVGEEVNCIFIFHVKDNKPEFVIRSLEKK